MNGFEKMLEERISTRIVRYRSLGKVWGLIFAAMTLIGVLLSIHEIFRLGFLVYHEYLYYYGLAAIFLSPTFLIFPISKKAPKDKIPWYDFLLFLLTIICCAYVMVNAMKIALEGWVEVGPTSSIVVSILMWGISLEALRRIGGLSLLAFAFVFSIYPLFAEYMPGFLEGAGWSFVGAAKYHVLTAESVIGIPMQTFCQLVIGFMIFSSILQATGGGLFFTKFAYAIFGKVRGGPAKVSVVASSFFGTISGSAVANVAVDGWITIPTMKRSGYEAEYASAVEAVASAGGQIMPPVMGATAFIMASFLMVPYAEVAIAAIVPACLFYWGLFVQIDGHAAKKGLKGLSRDEIPSLKETLKEGWIYFFSIIIPEKSMKIMFF
jgi:TRAP transporter 4TM/12TM fusion protein